VHLAAGRDWEASRAEPAVRHALQFSEQFVKRHALVIDSLSRAVVEERASSPAMVDADVRAGLDALQATVRTLESGLYYDTRPAGGLAAASLYRRMKALLDDWMRPQSSDLGALKVSEAAAVLEFLVRTHELHGSERPRSRRYLDWLSAMVPRDREKTEDPGRLILP
jgi:hypothetical protein